MKIHHQHAAGLHVDKQQQKHQLKVSMCCTKCEEKVLEEIWEAASVSDVRAYWKENKVIVTTIPVPTGLDKDEILRKARKFDRKASFVKLDPKETRPPESDVKKRRPEPNLKERWPTRRDSLPMWYPVVPMPTEYRPTEPQYEVGRGGYWDNDEALRKARKIGGEYMFDVDFDPNERRSDPKPQPAPNYQYIGPERHTVLRPTEYRSKPSITGYEPQPAYFLLFALLVVAMFYALTL